MLEVVEGNGWTAIKNRGLWVFGVSDSADLLPTSGVQEGAIVWDHSSQALLAFSSGAWGAASPTFGETTVSEFTGSGGDLVLDSLSFAGASWDSTYLITSGGSGSPLSAVEGTSVLLGLHSIKEDAGFHYHQFHTAHLGVADGAGIVGFHHTLYLDDGASTDTAQAGQFHLNLVSGSTLKAGSFPAIGACLWLKAYGKATAVAENAIIAPLWIDNMLTEGAVGAGAREYGAILGVGGTVPYAAFGFHSTGAGWTNLFDFRQNVAPVGAAAGGGEVSIKICVAGTTYYIPLFDALD